jgi:Tfp pilus assembly protein PilO
VPIDFPQIKAILIIVAIALALGVGIWGPAAYQRSGLRATADQIHKELGTEPDATAQCGNIYSEVIALRREAEGEQNIIPDTDQLAKFQRRFTETLMTHGMTETNKVTQPIRHFADYSVMPVSLDFTGSFTGGYGVLQQIEAMPRLIRIDALKISRPVSNTEGPLQVRLKLSTFVSAKAKAGAL